MRSPLEEVPELEEGPQPRVLTPRGRRAGTFALPDVSCVDIVALEESVQGVDWERLAHILPLMLR